MLLTFTTFANAAEGRYTMVNQAEGSPGAWILDSEQGVLKYCVKQYIEHQIYEIHCSKWKILYDGD